MKLADHLDKLKAFQIVAKSATISSAAEHLRITQPALSRQIQLLEDVLGCPLIHRSQKGIQLTSDGESLALLAGKILNEVDLLESRLMMKKGRTQSRLRVGTFESLAISIIPPVMEAATADIPNLLLTVTTGDSESLYRSLMIGEIDILLGSPKDEPRSKIQSLWSVSDSYGFYCSGKFKKKNFASSNKTKTAIEDLPIALVKAAETNHRTLEQSLASSGFFFSRQLEVGTLEAVKNLALHHSAIAVLPQLIAAPEMRSGRLVEAPVKGSTRRVGHHSIGAYIHTENHSPSLNELSTLLHQRVSQTVLLARL